MRLLVWQVIYVVAGAVLLPFSPLLYLQGQYTRRKVGLLPGAGGPNTGATADGDAVKLLVIGESTVAGLGARDHERAMAGQFARRLSDRLQRPVKWTVIGKNGVTAGRTITELVPQIPDEKFDYILIGLGGNDVLKLSSPRKWRRDITHLITILRDRNPDAVIFLSNCPMIKASPAIPQPIKFLLWKLSNMHDANVREITAAMDRTFYYHQPRKIDVEGFFADGIHPSEKGYSDWTEAMMIFFDDNYRWRQTR